MLINPVTSHMKIACSKTWVNSQTTQIKIQVAMIIEDTGIYLNVF